MNQHTSEDLFRLLHVQLEKEASEKVRAKIDAAFGNGHPVEIFPRGCVASVVEIGKPVKRKYRLTAAGKAKRLKALRAYYAKRREQGRGKA